MNPLHRCGPRWSRMPLLLMVSVALELLAVHPAPVLGALELQLDEEQPAGTVVGDISAGLPAGVTAALYFISDHEGTGVGTDLDIDESTGVIKTARVLDRELRDRYHFIAVTMTGVTVEVTIRVNDINDHGPVFPKKRAAFGIPEQTAIGTKFPLDPAADADGGLLSTQGYLIKDGNIGQAFTLETRRGSNEVLYLDLVVNAILDREKRSTYTLSLEAFDGGSPKRADQMTLDITVQDINDNAPVFNQSRYHAIISENLPPESNILQVFATDADQGDNGLVLYEINRRQSDPDRYFVIDRHSGVITLNQPLDFEMRRVHELVVQAQDNASQPEVTNAFVTIHVRDYNDNQPTMTIIFLSEDGSPRISEGAQPGQYVARISVTDPDYGDIDAETGIITTLSQLDYEKDPAPSIRVVATDGGRPPLSSTAVVNVVLQDMNDNEPVFGSSFYNVSIKENTPAGTCILEDDGDEDDVESVSFGP
ncbi:hypothetical protein CRUP_011240 [Coryphaenoides rupestris]|nr:hypothetical protein CRUP_011240 [Coryphaenoides rupestris]